MFNLESSITAWRQQMFTAGITTPAALDELELHLREEIERQIKSGLDGPQSFHAAVRIIGYADPLGTEYNKISGQPGSRLVKLLALACGGLAGLFTAWVLFVLLTIHESSWPERISGLLIIGAIIVTWRQAGKWLPAIRHPWFRPLAGVLCCLASLGGMSLFVTTILPYYLERMVLADLPPGQIMVIFLWTWAAATMFGILAYKLQVSTGKSHTRHV